MSAAADVPVVFLCPGKPGKPTHDCTPEAVAALEYALKAAPDTWASAPAVEADADADLPPKDTYKLSTVQRWVDEPERRRVRAQVLCRDPDCGTTSILTDSLIRDAEPRGDKAMIALLAPTPGDLALIEAAKGVTGLSALKAATANATFVLGNLALVGTAVTTLGLAKAEEIGAKLVEGEALALLLIALALTVLAIYRALEAQVVSTGQVQSANLEEVRELVNREVSWRAKKARESINALAAAVVAVGIAFAIVALADDGDPVGTLTVVPEAGTLDLTIETKWTGAPEGARLVVSAVGDAGVTVLEHEADAKDGTAELKRATEVSSTAGMLRIRSVLENESGGAIAGAEKEKCLRVRASALADAACP